MSCTLKGFEMDTLLGGSEPSAVVGTTWQQTLLPSAFLLAALLTMFVGTFEFGQYPCGKFYLKPRNRLF